MTRQFKTIADAVPYRQKVHAINEVKEISYFTAAETAQLMRMYAYSCVHSFLPEHDEIVRQIEAKIAKWEQTA